ncbi:MAG TPA: hypothetical protein VK817_01075 [Trebonia sp.]|jgi:hypothetical protein|nr:hypothetical protein [Trebonia sp.]
MTEPGRYASVGCMMNCPSERSADLARRNRVYVRLLLAKKQPRFAALLERTASELAREAGAGICPVCGTASQDPALSRTGRE